MKLSLRVRFGPPYDPLLGSEPLQYEVVGLPPNLVVWIGRRLSPPIGRWQIMRVGVEENGSWVKGFWTGDYDSAEAALAALQAELSAE